MLQLQISCADCFLAKLKDYKLATIENHLSSLANTMIN
jgi:hypothetical protein